MCLGRGVLQTLVEKHFPAPDRNRIHRLLGLDPPRKSDHGKVNNNGDADAEAGGSSGKRKPGTVKHSVTRILTVLRYVFFVPVLSIKVTEI
jgi:hypothetical protein